MFSSFWRSQYDFRVLSFCSWIHIRVIIYGVGCVCEMGEMVKYRKEGKLAVEVLGEERERDQGRKVAEQLPGSSLRLYADLKHTSVLRKHHVHVNVAGLLRVLSVFLYPGTLWTERDELLPSRTQINFISQGELHAAYLFKRMLIYQIFLDFGADISKFSGETMRGNSAVNFIYMTSRRAEQQNVWQQKNVFHIEGNNTKQKHKELTISKAILSACLHFKCWELVAFPNQVLQVYTISKLALQLLFAQRQAWLTRLWRALFLRTWYNGNLG